MIHTRALTKTFKVRDNQDLFYIVQQTLLFPLLFLSGMMLPVGLALGTSAMRRSTT